MLKHKKMKLMNAFWTTLNKRARNWEEMNKKMDTMETSTYNII